MAAQSRAPLLFAPSPDQSAVRHLRILIRSVKPLPDGSLVMDIICGDIGCRMLVPNAPGRPDFAPGQCYLIEYPKGQNPLAGQFTAIYPADQKPQPERKTAMTAMIVPNSHPVTMSSREIAELVEARHNDVVATIERLFEKGLLRSSRKSRREATGGRPIDVYDLIERDTHLVVAGYSDEHRARVIDRWQELEAKAQQPAIPQTLPDALRLAADLAEQKARAEEALALAAPKAAALDRIAAIPEGSLCITDAAKALGKAPKALFKWLQERQWIYRRPGGSHWIAYQHRLQTGVLDHKITTITKNDGSEKIIEQVLVTAKGMARLSELMEAVA
jgi:phage antirepressor YoqD-like protein